MQSYNCKNCDHLFKPRKPYYKVCPTCHNTPVRNSSPTRTYINVESIKLNGQQRWFDRETKILFDRETQEAYGVLVGDKVKSLGDKQIRWLETSNIEIVKKEKFKPCHKNSPNFYLLSDPGDRHEDMSPLGLFSDMHELFKYLKTIDDAERDLFIHILKLNEEWDYQIRINFDLDYIIHMEKDCIVINNEKYTLSNLPRHLEGNLR
uniref:Uncharacterized protein n=1 Tax=Marseillevirus LCMAC102 TaxID=2506603 RepID=A0A481YT69_9VIRU|nr:MAG: hypothetical protein LCMAC102_00740 [Marseillevirus LCMAC102]